MLYHCRGEWGRPAENRALHAESAAATAPASSSPNAATFVTPTRLHAASASPPSTWDSPATGFPPSVSVPATPRRPRCCIWPRWAPRLWRSERHVVGRRRTPTAEDSCQSAFPWHVTIDSSASNWVACRNAVCGAKVDAHGFGSTSSAASTVHGPWGQRVQGGPRIMISCTGWPQNNDIVYRVAPE